MRFESGQHDLVPEGTGFLRAVIDALPAEVCVIDTDAKIVAVNESWTTFGTSNEIIREYGVGTNYLAGMKTTGDTEDVQIARDAFNGVESVLAGRAPAYRLEYPCHAPDDQRWFLMTATPLHLPEMDGPCGAVITHQNITGRILTERKTQRLMSDLQGQERRLDELLRDVPASVWEAVTDADAETITWVYGSAHTRAMLGYPVADWLSQPNFFYQRIKPDERDRVRREIATLIDGERNGLLNFTWLTRDEREIRVESVTNITPEDGGVFRLRCVTTDVTRRLQVQETLRTRAKLLVTTARDLRRSNAELDQFAYVASHDLRAPLRGIRQLADFIGEDLGEAVGDDVRTKLELMQERVSRMERLIDGLLQYGRIGRIVAKPERIDVETVLDEVLEMLDIPEAVQIHRSMGCGKIRADKMRLMQVLQNLISNAIHHHDRLSDGPANVWISCRDSGDHWAIEVRDDGPGIDPKYHGKVFEMFQTLNDGASRKSTGIGLSLVAKIAAHLETKVSLCSEGRGAAFTFRWPKRMPRKHESLWSKV
ncbi:MAG: ATP-binding protein [Planctomycetota bacterium]